MPRFFDSENLTDDQRSRWDWAMAEYARIQSANVTARLEKMSEAEKAAALATFRGEREGDARTLHEYMTEFQALFAGGAGDAKSALFARLLDGKSALRSPPPTSFSYPWYEVIEGAGEFPVTIDGVDRLGDQGEGDALGVGINQCSWNVISHNEAAGRLIELQKALSAAPCAGADNRPVWTPDFLGAVIDAYSAGPTFIVRFGDWAEYRLRLGRIEFHSQRGFAMASIADVEGRRGDAFSACLGVFDVGRLFLNAEFGEVLVKAKHPRDRLDEGLPGSNIPRGARDRILADWAAQLDSDIAKFDADPAADDFLRVHCDGWVLEKAFIRAPFSDQEVQRLNEYQTGTGDGLPSHPFTCGSRGDSPHGQEGDDTGVLVATSGGWVCPHCEYTQDWAHAGMAVRGPALDESAGEWVSLFRGSVREKLPARLRAYQALAAEGKPGAETMVACLLARQQEMGGDGHKR